MKKSLLALAVLAASGAAFAQSSVTLYGVADLAITKTTGSGTQMSGNGAMNNGNSRFGLRGTEDLGGGMKASFNVEAAVNAENGATELSAQTTKLATGETVVTGATPTTFQRAAWAELSGGFGAVRLGRGLTNGFYAAAAHELTGTANYSAWAATFGFTGGTRNNSEIRYTTPQFVPGLTASIGYILKDDNGGKAKVDFNTIYAAGPLAASVAYSKVTDGEKSYMIGGSYNLGVAKIAASYQDPAGVKKGFTIGAIAPFGPASIAVDIARDTNAKLTNFVVEGKYNLSKRTSLYAAVLRMDGATTTTSTGVGVRHNF